MKRDPPKESTTHGDSRRAHRWLPWLVGAVAIGLFVAGGILSAARGGRLSRLPGFGLQEPKNELADAKSPYLRSAAEQPVAWQQWGPDAFALARELDRPIWLDIGAIWCHWCHVMDRESYENEEIAALINESFVPIKVDRDERPDIDGRYQAAHTAINGRGGGWPVTMFLTPDGEPFAGGTYFPPDTRGGRPGLRQIAPQIATAFRDQRGEVDKAGRQVREHLATLRSAAGAEGELEPDVVGSVAEMVGKQFDPRYGGFGNSERPKFPNGEAIRLALAHAFLAGDDGLRRSALGTLDAYARSGMRDHVNGGFFDRPDEPALLADRAKQYTDSPLPGGNAVAARALDKLYLLTSRQRWRELADQTLAAFAGAARVFGSDPTPRAYVCVGETCAPPTTEPAQVAELVRDYGRIGER